MAAVTATTATTGAIYALTETANGTAFPLRLHASNLSQGEANIIHQLYVDILGDKTLYNQPLSDRLVDTIEKSTDKRISQLGDYLKLKKISYRDMLSHLVYEGKKTEPKNEGRLMTFPENKEKNLPAVVSLPKAFDFTSSHFKDQLSALFCFKLATTKCSSP